MTTAWDKLDLHKRRVEAERQVAGTAVDVERLHMAVRSVMRTPAGELMLAWLGTKVGYSLAPTSSAQELWFLEGQRALIEELHRINNEA